MEQKQIFGQLKDTFSELIQILSSFDYEGFNLAPFPGSWSAGELSQHLVKSTGAFVKLINGPVIENDKSPDTLAYRIKSDFLDFSVKVKSAAFIAPEEKVYDRAVQIDILTDLCNKILEAEKHDLTVKCTLFEIPPYGSFSRYEALTLVLYHTQRHIRQLKNIYQEVEQKKDRV